MPIESRTVRTLGALALTLVAALAAAAIAGAKEAPLEAGKGIGMAPVDQNTGIVSADGAWRYTTLGDCCGGTTVAKIDTDGGAVVRSRVIDTNGGRMMIPPVTVEQLPGGLSADGGTLVLADTDNMFAGEYGDSRFAVLDSDRLHRVDSIELRGAYAFDAVSPDGSKVFLIHQFDPYRDPLDYEVNVYDVERGKLARDPVIDPAEPEEAMGGYPYARATSPDGRWAYTLYGGGDEPFIHALDTERATAKCIDLDEIGVSIGPRTSLGAAADGSALTVFQERQTVTEPVASVDTANWEVGPPEASSIAPGADPDGGTGFDWPVVAVAALVALLAGVALVRGPLGWREEDSGTDQRPKSLGI